MKKIGIITLNGNYNYGNRLQNFALQEVLKTYDYNVETILVEQTKKKASIIRKIIRILTTPSIIFKKINNLKYSDKRFKDVENLEELNAKRVERFKEFSKQYINETLFSIKENSLQKELLSKYEYFVTGSDQVWNPYSTNASSLYFLTFAPKSKRIAYSPSFGISEMPKQYIKDYKKWLQEMAYLSVREEAGADIIKQLTNREAKVLVDPTLLLSKEDWLLIAKPATNKPEKDMLVTYFLGDIPNEIQKIVNVKKKKYNLTVVNLANPKEKDFYLTDPSEFLNYIHTAKLFLTDSFHGSVFSILFETPFIVTDRKGKVHSMNSRITNLLSTFNLENRHINKIEDKDLFNADYSHIPPILIKERNRAFEYLSAALLKKK